MQELLLDLDEELVRVQEEPALEIAMPEVSAQPPLVVIQRGQLRDVESRIARLGLLAGQNNGHGPVALGPDYQALVTEFEPLFRWALASWDYVLSTAGCRFVLRNSSEKWCARGDYRAVTDKDFSRLAHRIFREFVVTCAHQTEEPSFANVLRARFWEALAHAYRQLEDPPDPRQRTLTAYSYLRCVPYQFLNAFHHELVHSTLRGLEAPVLHAIRCYFLEFCTLEAAAHAMHRTPSDVEALLRQGLRALLVHHRLVYCLLRQIERY